VKKKIEEEAKPLDENIMSGSASRAAIIKK